MVDKVTGLVFRGKMTVKNGKKFYELAKIFLFENKEKKNKNSPDFWGYARFNDDDELKIGLWEVKK